MARAMLIVSKHYNPQFCAESEKQGGGSSGRRSKLEKYMASGFLKAAMLRHLRVPVAEALTLNGRNLRWVRSISTDSQQHSEDEAVISAAMDVIQSNHDKKCVKSFISVVANHPKVKFYHPDKTFQMRVMSTVLDYLQQDPQVSPYWVFQGRCVVRMFSSDGTEDLTKDQVSSMVLDIVRSYATSYASKVTDEAYFCKDLGFFESDIKLIMFAFQLEFKLIIPKEDYSKFSTCKSAVEYIYNRLSERLPLGKFQEKLYGRD